MPRDRLFSAIKACNKAIRLGAHDTHLSQKNVAPAEPAPACLKVGAGAQSNQHHFGTICLIRWCSGLGPSLRWGDVISCHSLMLRGLGGPIWPAPLSPQLKACWGRLRWGDGLSHHSSQSRSLKTFLIQS